MHSSIDVANYFIKKSGNDGVDHLKLQKLVYIAYGYYLAFRDKSLMEESPEVWTDGPVFPELYQSVKESHADWRKNSKVEMLPNEDGTEIDKNDLGILDATWKGYGSQPGFVLSGLTHKEDTPWSRVRKEALGENWNLYVPKSTKIPEDMIKKYYKELLNVAN